MPSKSSKSTKSKGCVGLVFGGVLKVSTVRAFYCDESEPSEFATKLTDYYGDSFDIKFVQVENQSDVYEKFLESFESDERVAETPLFKVSISEASNALKKVSGAKACKSFSLKKKEKSKEEDEQQKSEHSDEEEEKPKKKSDKKQVKTKKVESDDEKSEDEHDKSEQSDEEEEEKPKKSKSKSSSSSKKQKEDKHKHKEEEEDEDNDSDDEGQKLKKKQQVKKTEKKSGKSK